MSLLRLTLAEIRFRKINFLLALSAVVVAVGLFVAMQTLCAAMDREAIRVMRDMGFNLLILPADADMADFWSTGTTERDMPERHVHDLAESSAIGVRHLVAQLQQRIRWRGRTVLLTGILPEVPMAHLSHKQPMISGVPQGEVQIGYELARREGLKPGDTITIQGARTRDFKVSRCIERSTGSQDDIRIYAHLHDVQELLGKPGRINLIEALNCLCVDVSEADRLTHVREQILRVLPDTQVTLVRNIAAARERTRTMVSRYAARIIPAVLVACALWIGLLALSNVRERRVEIGILKAIGVSGGKVAAIFLCKAALLGLVGGLVGFWAGSWLAVHVGPQLFPQTARHMAPLYSLLWVAVLGAPLLSAAASYIPAMLALAQDPALVLRED